jgi:hypothetical protein
MDTMRVEFQSWFDDDDSDYIYTWVDIDTDERYADLEDARRYAEKNNLILEVINNIS